MYALYVSIGVIKKMMGHSEPCRDRSARLAEKLKFTL